MPSLLAFAMPLALLLPLAGSGGEGVGSADLTGPKAGASTLSGEQAGSKIELGSVQHPGSRTVVMPLDAFRSSQTARQIRIEQRVIVRISPRRTRNQNELLAQLPRQSLNQRYEERKMEKCVPVGSIAGVQTGSGNRLLLFMRDARIVSVNLEKACRAREFYSGFYVEQAEDGQLCVERDKLQSRSGAKCEVERMRQLVAVQE